MKKCCTKCSVEKPLTEFYRSKTNIDGLQGKCKICSNEHRKQWRLKNPEKIQQWKQNNPDYLKQWNQNNSNYMKQWNQNNSEKVKQWKLNNPDKIKAHKKKWATKKSGIYEWYEGDICLYVGQSTWLLSRICSHKYWLKNPSSARKSTQYLYEALRQHQNPQIHIIEECSPEILLEREQYYIDIKKPLYNKNNI